MKFSLIIEFLAGAITGYGARGLYSALTRKPEPCQKHFYGSLADEQACPICGYVVKKVK